MARLRFGRTGLLVAAVGMLLIVVGGWGLSRLLPHVSAIDVGPDADAVAVTTRFTATFSHPVGPISSDSFQFEPAVSGSVAIAGNRATFTPDSALQPDTAYTLTVRGATTPEGQTQRAGSAPFHTRAPVILYQMWDATGRLQLARLDPQTGAFVQLTQALNGIADYTVAPDGNSVAYTVQQPDGSSTLYRFNAHAVTEPEVWLTCADAVCRRPVWAPDGTLLVYERAPLDTPDATRLFWLEPDGGTTPVFSDATLLGYNAVFSPDTPESDAWLAFYSPPATAILLFNRRDGSSIVLPTVLDTPVVWRQDSTALVFQDIVPFAESFGVRLLTYDLATGETTPLTEDIRDDEAPWAWATDGTLFFGRKRAGTAMGRQVTELPPDADAAISRTADADIQHSLVTLSPDEQSLLMQQFQVNNPAAEPGIWLQDRTTWEMTPLAQPGIRPMWLP